MTSGVDGHQAGDPCSDYQVQAYTLRGEVAIRWEQLPGESVGKLTVTVRTGSTAYSQQVLTLQPDEVDGLCSCMSRLLDARYSV